MEHNADNVISFDINEEFASSVIFVEGHTNNTNIDVVFMQQLLELEKLESGSFELNIRVENMGGCENVRNAAQALIKAHPNYYFLIDRDDRSLREVESSWVDFPNPEKQNILIWRKRELENYFLDPDYLAQSKFLKVTTEQLKQEIIETCKRRFYLDIANLTLMSLGKEIRQLFKMPEFFGEVADFKNQENGLHKLEAVISPKLQAMADKIDSERQGNFIKKKYDEFINELSGGVLPLEYGHGTWLERMSGKEIFKEIAGCCFKVKDTNNKILQGELQHKEIIKDLVVLKK